MANIQEEMTTLDMEGAVKDQVVTPPVENDIEIEIIDDTPETDRGKKPIQADKIIADEDEVASYSDKVKSRIDKLTRGYNDERRLREAKERENDEVIRYAQGLVEKNKNLTARTNAASTQAVETWKSKAITDLEIAKNKYKAAYEAGDSDQLVEAQEGLNRATFRHEQSLQYKQPPLQTPEEGVQSKPASVYTAPAPDPQAESWAANNPWFGKDRRMTSLAYGIHEDLIAAEIHPERDAAKYYAEINSAMRKSFPDYSWPDRESGEPAPANRRPANVVAPVTRSKTSKRVTLTASQVAVAKRLNIPLAEYARQDAALKGAN